jgi:hypothetical protein
MIYTTRFGLGLLYYVPFLILLRFHLRIEIYHTLPFPCLLMTNILSAQASVLCSNDSACHSHQNTSDNDYT